MLFAGTSMSIGSTRLSINVGAAEDFLVLTVHRENAAYDTRVLPSTAPLFELGCVIALILEGGIAWHPTKEQHSAPIVALIDAADWDSCRSGGPTFRTEGALFRAVEIRVPNEMAAPTGAPRPMDDPALRACAERYFALAFDPGETGPSREALLDAACALASELHRAGLLVRDPRETLRATEPTNLVHIWSVVAEMLAREDLGATLAMVADQASLSERQVNRDIATIIQRLGLTYGGWRDAANRWRLRAATVLLSGPDSSVEQVARTVGFSGSTALGLAFKRANMPSPKQVRAQLLASDEP
jgi:AraC-like DNA-binding protein